ncbi:hypothetical protein ABB26_03460 [Stenotrophomonas humi]|uniref:Uncharacterized protein n=2 Tax=Stenotrophomonas humi TaxID=405444 RepID=A0A0R0C7G5_9GAMM|nr:hypothetical protein ABB26_03460 [Stenotrophomonas humi]
MVEARRAGGVPGRQNNAWCVCSPIRWSAAGPVAGAWLVHDPDLRRCIECDANQDAWRTVIAQQQAFASVITRIEAAAVSSIGG